MMDFPSGTAAAPHARRRDTKVFVKSMLKVWASCVQWLLEMYRMKKWNLIEGQCDDVNWFEILMELNILPFISDILHQLVLDVVDFAVCPAHYGFRLSTLPEYSVTTVVCWISA